MAQVFRDMRRAASLKRKLEAEAEAPSSSAAAEGPPKRATLKQRIRSLRRLLASEVREHAPEHLAHQHGKQRRAHVS